MSKLTKCIVLLSIVIALMCSSVYAVLTKNKTIDQLDGMKSAGIYQTLIAQIEPRTTKIHLMNKNGVVLKSLSVPREDKGRLVSVADMAMDDTGYVYLLIHYLDINTGSYLGQAVATYDMNRWLFEKCGTNEIIREDGVQFRWLFLTETVTLLGIDKMQTTLTRTAYSLESLRASNEPLKKGERTYSLFDKDGIWRAMPLEMDVAYISKSGKVFMAGQGNAPAQELYPARALEEVMFPMFLIPQGTNLLLGEQESGDLVMLEVQAINTKKVKGGTEPFISGSEYTTSDLLDMTARDLSNFTGVVKNQTTGAYEFIVSNEGNVEIITSLSKPFMDFVIQFIVQTLMFTAALLSLTAMFFMLFKMIRQSTSILIKLAFCAIPLIIITLAAFGVLSYRTYSASVQQSYQKQITDEGNMLAALFGTESFGEIEFPYDYVKEGYSYLIQQMNTRTNYTRTAYYERMQLFTGVDKYAPCFYPFDIIMNKDAYELYLKAANFGTAQSGIIDDARGRRLSCVTPIGGISGSSVYLLETGILISNVENYTQKYAFNYILISAAFIVAISFFLIFSFRKVLTPLAKIKNGIEEFANGNRAIRLECKTNDELSDISRVFNQMASDVDVQIFNLNKVSETYYRFLPEQMLRLLGKGNLGDIVLGSRMEGEHAVVCIHLFLKQIPAEASREIINSTYNGIRDICDSAEAVLIPNQANLRSMQIVCPMGVESAITIALSAISRIDEVNVSLPVQSYVDMLFVVHKTALYYGICGDENRLTPALLSDDLDWLSSKLNILRQISSRLIVTDCAYQDLDASKYDNRYIGNLERLTQANLGIYDFYDSYPAELTRLLNLTKDMFLKAMELYNQGRSYDAKNLFVLVLRENQYDNVARYYLFECEKRIKKLVTV